MSLTQMPTTGPVKIKDVKTVFRSYTDTLTPVGQVRASQMNTTMNSQLPAAKSRLRWSQLRGLTSGPPDPVLWVKYGTSSLPTTDNTTPIKYLKAFNTTYSMNDTTRSYVGAYQDNAYQLVTYDAAATQPFLVPVTYTKAFFIRLTQYPSTAQVVDILSSAAAVSNSHWVWMDTSYRINAGHSTGTTRPTASVTDPTALPINTWVHIAITYDNTTNVMKLYRDGVLTVTSAVTPSLSWSGGGGLAICRSTNASNTNTFTTYLDEVQIYDKCLTDTQVQQVATPITAVAEPYVGTIRLKDVYNNRYIRIQRVTTNSVRGELAYSTETITVEDPQYATIFTVSNAVVPATPKSNGFYTISFDAENGSGARATYYLAADSSQNTSFYPNAAYRVMGSTTYGTTSLVGYTNNVTASNYHFTFLPTQTQGRYMIRSEAKNGVYNMALVYGGTNGDPTTNTYREWRSYGQGTQSAQGINFTGYTSQFIVESVSVLPTFILRAPILVYDSWSGGVLAKIYPTSEVVNSSRSLDLQSSGNTPTLTSITGTTSSWDNKIFSLLVPDGYDVTVYEDATNTSAGRVLLKNWNALTATNGRYRWPNYAKYLPSRIDITVVNFYTTNNTNNATETFPAASIQPSITLENISGYRTSQSLATTENIYPFIPGDYETNINITSRTWNVSELGTNTNWSGNLEKITVPTGIQARVYSAQNASGTEIARVTGSTGYTFSFIAYDGPQSITFTRSYTEGAGSISTNYPSTRQDVSYTRLDTGENNRLYFNLASATFKYDTQLGYYAEFLWGAVSGAGDLKFVDVPDGYEVRCYQSDNSYLAIWKTNGYDYRPNAIKYYNGPFNYYNIDISTSFNDRGTDLQKWDNPTFRIYLRGGFYNPDIVFSTNPDLIPLYYRRFKRDSNISIGYEKNSFTFSYNAYSATFGGLAGKRVGLTTDTTTTNMGPSYILDDTTNSGVAFRVLNTGNWAYDKTNDFMYVELALASDTGRRIVNKGAADNQPNLSYGIVGDVLVAGYSWQLGAYQYTKFIFKYSGERDTYWWLASYYTNTDYGGGYQIQGYKPVEYLTQESGGPVKYGPYISNWVESLGIFGGNQGLVYPPNNYAQTKWYIAPA